MKHVITKHANNTMHLREIDPETGEPNAKAIKFSSVIAYDTDVVFPVYQKREGSWVETERLSLSRLLKAPKRENTIYDSLRRATNGEYKWEMFESDRRAKLKMMDVDTERMDQPLREPPSAKIERALKGKSLKRSELESLLKMDTKAVRKCLRWMYNQKTIEMDSNGYYTLKEQSDE